MFSNLLLGAALLASLALPPQSQYVRSQFAQCPSGEVLEIQLYDPDPTDNEALIVVYKKGTHVLGVENVKTRTITLNDGQSMTVDEARAKYGTPCNLPDGTGL